MTALRTRHTDAPPAIVRSLAELEFRNRQSRAEAIERRRVREARLTAIHLENMLAALRAERGQSRVTRKRARRIVRELPCKFEAPLGSIRLNANSPDELLPFTTDLGESI